MAKKTSPRSVTWALVRGARRYRSAADTQLRALGLSDATALPVLFLQRLGDTVRQGELAEELGVEGPSLVRVLDQLEEQGLVERREDPRDRRARLLKLTPQGRNLSRRAEEALDQLRAELFAGIGDADLATCLSVLETLAARMHKRGDGA